MIKYRMDCLFMPNGAYGQRGNRNRCDTVTPTIEIILAGEIGLGSGSMDRRLLPRVAPCSALALLQQSVDYHFPNCGIHCPKDLQVRPSFLNEHCASKDYDGGDDADGFERIAVLHTIEPRTILSWPPAPTHCARGPWRSILNEISGLSKSCCRRSFKGDPPQRFELLRGPHGLE
jgi:hypothetical protein